MHLIAVFSRDQKFSIITINDLSLQQFDLGNWIVESATILKSADDDQILLGGYDGTIKIWSISSSSQIFEQQVSRRVFRCFHFFWKISNKLRSPIENINCCPSSTDEQIVAFSSECNLVFFDLKEHRVLKQLTGYNDEVFDGIMIASSTCIAVATNSPDLRVYDLSNSHQFIINGNVKLNMTTILLIFLGHTEAILSVDSSSWDNCNL